MADRSDATRRERNHHHETYGQHERLCRRRDAGARRAGGGPQRRVRAGGWAMPHFDSETAALIGEVYQRADAFLFGRRTYEIFAGSWGTGSWGKSGRQPDLSGVEHPAQVRGVEHAHRPAMGGHDRPLRRRRGRRRRAEGQAGGELQVVGSLSLVRLLLDNDLVDEITLLTYPVVVGQGTRLFPDSGPDLALELVESRATASGVTMQSTICAGRPAVRVGLPT